VYSKVLQIKRANIGVGGDGFVQIDRETGCFDRFGHVDDFLETRDSQCDVFGGDSSVVFNFDDK